MFKIILTKSLEELKMQTTTLLWLALNNENSEAGERIPLTAPTAWNQKTNIRCSVNSIKNCSSPVTNWCYVIIFNLGYRHTPLNTLVTRPMKQSKSILGMRVTVFSSSALQHKNKAELENIHFSLLRFKVVNPRTMLLNPPRLVKIRYIEPIFLHEFASRCVWNSSYIHSHSTYAHSFP